MGTEVSRETGEIIIGATILSAWTAIGSVTQWLYVAMIVACQIRPDADDAQIHDHLPLHL